ncbi:MAG: SIS domain-containing protein [Candidatus Bathyarchaeia archaeon]
MILRSSGEIKLATIEYCHNMVKEILEEPSAIRRTIAEEEENIKKIASEIEAKKYDIVYITGSGTSYHAGLASQYALSSLTDLIVSAIPASEFQRWVPASITRKALLMAISQSGESTDVVNAAKAALKRDIDLLAVTNTPKSTLASLANYVIYPRSGREMAVPATKTYVTQLMAIFMLSLEISALKEQASRIEELTRELYNVPQAIETIFDSSRENIREAAGKYKDKNPIFVLGSGPNYATALEAALKLKETCMVFAEGFAAREFLHGPIRLVDEKTLMVLISPSDEIEEYADLSRRFRGFGASVISILEGTETSRSLMEASDTFFPILTGLSKIFSPILFIVPVQLFTYYVSVFRGLNPDNPEKLVKVVR